MAGPNHEKAQADRAESANEVGFATPADAHDPLQWPLAKKVAIVLNVSLLAAVGQMASSMIAPAVPQILAEFQTRDGLLAVFVISVFPLGMAAGLLLISALSEVYGRVPVFTVSNLLFVIFAVATAVSTSLGQLIGFRLLLGLAASAPPSIGGGVIGDMFAPAQRGRATSVYAFGNLIGPLLGPVIGGYLAEGRGWRWACWLTAILGGAMVAVTLAVLRESYRPILLDRRVKRLRKETGNPDLYSALPHPGSGVEAVKKSLSRPFFLLTTSPIVFLPAFGLAVIYGLMILMISTLAVVFQDRYGFSVGSSGLAYLGFGVGLIAGLIAFAFTSDRAYESLVARTGGAPKPEMRLAPITIGSPLACIGLIVYGWGIQEEVHWMLPLVGSAIFATAIIAFIMPVTTYLIEVFRQLAAGPVGASAVLRSVVGGVLPLCANSLYNRLGLGWGNTLLAFIALVFTPLPWLFYRNGEELRRRFPPK